MVLGTLLDASTARQRNVSVLQVVSEGNRLIATQIPLPWKVAFWLTNLPYFALAAELAFGAPPRVSPQGAHALAVSVVACVSTLFHGSVLFGALDSPWPARLLSADITCANGYGVALACQCGWSMALWQFSLPLLLLAAAARSKRSGRVGTYAWCHGTWHVASCHAMWRCLYT